MYEHDYDFDNIPMDLKSVAQWIVWYEVPVEGDKPKKVPFSIVSNSSKEWIKAENWASFDAVRNHYNENKGSSMRFSSGLGNLAGIGFVLVPPFVGIDLDNCIEDNGMMDEFSREIANTFDSTFIEYSVSGKGVHIYCTSDKEIESVKTEQIEIYNKGRYFVVTGKSVNSADKVDKLTFEVLELSRKYGNMTGAVQESPISLGEKKVLELVNKSTRNSTLASEAGRLMRIGYSKQAVFEMLKARNINYYNPPLDEKEIMSVVESISQYHQNNLSEMEKETELVEYVTEEIGKVPEDKSPIEMVDCGNRILRHIADIKDDLKRECLLKVLSDKLKPANITVAMLRKQLKAVDRQQKNQENSKSMDMVKGALFENLVDIVLIENEQGEECTAFLILGEDGKL